MFVDLNIYQLACKPRLFYENQTDKRMKDDDGSLASDDVKAQLYPFNMNRFSSMERRIKNPNQDSEIDQLNKSALDLMEQREVRKKELQAKRKDSEKMPPDENLKLMKQMSQCQEEYIDAGLFNRLKEVLFCSVCSDMYVDPQNVKQCLHKFCAACIEDQIRL